MCNYCLNYRSRNNPGRRRSCSIWSSRTGASDGAECIVAFSGGRDSSYGLHYVNELGMNPVAFTYDWGMVTDLARRNISRMCGKLGVEHIIVAGGHHEEARLHRARTSRRG